jgi:hypothetical protein
MSDLIKHKQPMSGWIMLIFWWAMILFALHSATHMVGAGDTWVAMACGRHFLNHGVDTVEPFSANSHKAGPTAADVEKWPSWAQKITKTVGLETVQKWHPTGWVNQNWLTHVFFYWLTHLTPIADAETFDKPIVEQKITYDSLVYWKYALYIATIIVVYYTGRALGANMALSAIFACFALFVGRSFFDIRPAGFSNMLTAVLLFIFVLAVYKNYLYIWLIVPVTVLWCNLHGGYVYVFIVLVPFIGLHFFTLIPKRISMGLYFSIGWLFLYAMALKFLGHKVIVEGLSETALPSPINKDVLFWFIIAFIAANLVLVVLKNIKPAIVSLYQIIVTIVVFLAVVGRFFLSGLDSLVSNNQLFKDYVADSRLSFFVAFIGFVIVAMLIGLFRQRLQTVSVKGWSHTVAASVVAFVAMIIFNPFHLTNLTHTFEVSVSEHAKMWKTVNEWHPAFEWDNPVGDEIPFLIMYIIAWVLLALWVFALLLKPKIIVKKVKAQTEPQESLSQPQYEWPKIDLPLLTIAAMTVYMAIGSRRFIPVAAIAACPILAMFIDSITKMTITSRIFVPIYTILTVIISFAVSILVHEKIIDMSFSILLFQKKIDLTILQLIFFIVAALIVSIYADFCIKSHIKQTPNTLYMNEKEKNRLAMFIFIVVMFLSIWWGYWYNAIYLKPWPDSGYLTSVFMRMSASYAKPFKACQFVRDNKMSGKVFNYWTEGGFLAYGQFTDPNTGKTPLQLFMDGRAQAAYNTDAYQRWMYIMSGGDPVRQAEWAGRSLTNSDYQKVGEWLDEQFIKENVWVVFMPAAQFDSVLLKGLETNPTWRPAYMDDEQEIFVNVKTEQGRALYTGIFNGTTKFPDEFSRLLTTGYNIVRLQDGDANTAFAMLEKALSIKPSNTAAIELIRIAHNNPQLHAKLSKIFNAYFSDYVENKNNYMKKDGYRDRMMATMIVGNYLSSLDPVFKQKYDNEIYPQFGVELEAIGKTSRW